LRLLLSQATIFFFNDRNRERLEAAFSIVLHTGLVLVQDEVLLATPTIWLTILKRTFNDDTTSIGDKEDGFLLAKLEICT